MLLPCLTYGYPLLSFEHRGLLRADGDVYTCMEKQQKHLRTLRFACPHFVLLCGRCGCGMNSFTAYRFTHFKVSTTTRYLFTRCRGKRQTSFELDALLRAVRLQTEPYRAMKKRKKTNPKLTRTYASPHLYYTTGAPCAPAQKHKAASYNLPAQKWHQKYRSSPSHSLSPGNLLSNLVRIFYLSPLPTSNHRWNLQNPKP